MRKSSRALSRHTGNAGLRSSLEAMAAEAEGTLTLTRVAAGEQMLHTQTPFVIVYRGRQVEQRGLANGSAFNTEQEGVGCQDSFCWSNKAGANWPSARVAQSFGMLRWEEAAV
ncbi:hypothetical protein HaLaN_15622 [Haematococcus lacustris]|uniref:Uncharacterized protein n=1 Tax=Haematococcus lacustris TaxID=44745 RepID=A0A699ZI68_HAELA|nr:hypothetical protein HaLaN_15622 [Haematococcus lacustris]